MKSTQVESHNSKESLLDKLSKLIAGFGMENLSITCAGGKSFVDIYNIMLPLLSNYPCMLLDERLVSLSDYRSNRFSIRKDYVNFQCCLLNNLTKKEVYNNLDRLNKKCESILSSSRNICFMGVGEDWHVASLFEQMNLRLKNKYVAIIKRPNENFERFTLTHESLLLFDIVFIVIRKGKESIIENIGSPPVGSQFYKFLSDPKRRSKIHIFYLND